MGAGTYAIAQQAWARGLRTCVDSNCTTWNPFLSNHGTANPTPGCWNVETHMNQNDPTGWGRWGTPGSTTAARVTIHRACP
jgi:hypothetical protein